MNKFRDSNPRDPHTFSEGTWALQACINSWIPSEKTSPAWRLIPSDSANQQKCVMIHMPQRSQKPGSNNTSSCGWTPQPTITIFETEVGQEPKPGKKQHANPRIVDQPKCHRRSTWRFVGAEPLGTPRNASPKAFL